MKKARIVTNSGKVYEMTMYEANRWIVRNNIKDFVCHQVGSIVWFYVRG